MGQLSNTLNGCSVFEILRLRVLKLKYFRLEGIETEQPDNQHEHERMNQNDQW